MGASAWYQTGPYLPDFEQALLVVQTELMRERGMDTDGQTPEDLWQDEEWCEFMATGGTATPLDVCRVVEPDDTTDEGVAGVRPMTHREFSALLGVDKPTYADFVDGYCDGRIENYTGRGVARCAVLHKDGVPHEIIYWGCTID